MNRFSISSGLIVVDSEPEYASNIVIVCATEKDALKAVKLLNELNTRYRTKWGMKNET